MNCLLLSDLHFGFTDKTMKIWTKYWDKEIKDAAYDVVIIAGDLGTTKYKHFSSGIRFLRRHTDKPILLVRGNHDLWDRGYKKLDALIKKQQELCTKYNVHLLQDFGPVTIDGYFFTGWDGFYASNPQSWSNDFYYLPDDADFTRLSNRADIGFQAVLDGLFYWPPDKTTVVTHMPCFPGYGDPKYNANPRLIEHLVGLTNVLCCGHSHKAMDIDIRGTEVLNVGSDYNKPKHLIFKV